MCSAWLSPGSRLLVAGVVVPDLSNSGEDSELLDLPYRLSDRAFRFFLRILRPVRTPLDRTLDRPVTREELKPIPELADMALLKRGMRLSVQPVTKAEFDIVLGLAGT